MSEGYRALRHGAAFGDVSARGRIEVRGRDRVRLLHNLTTSHVKGLATGGGCYAFLLTPQGRIQADLRLLAFDAHFLIETDEELREKVPAYIRRYIIADQVELEDVTDRTGALAVEGPGAEAVLAGLGAPLPAEEFAHAEWGDATVARISLTGEPGWRIFATRERIQQLADELARAGAVLATSDDLRRVRIENGRPQFGVDIRETSLVQETQQMHAVSFNKGCYLGQEIVERVRSQGRVNRKLVRIEIAAAEAPEAGTKLTANGAEAGEITSAVYSEERGKVLGLAIVRTPFADPGTALDSAVTIL